MLRQSHGDTSADIDVSVRIAILFAGIVLFLLAGEARSATRDMLGEEESIRIAIEHG
jgi:hypothetical protein